MKKSRIRPKCKDKNIIKNRFTKNKKQKSSPFLCRCKNP